MADIITPKTLQEFEDTFVQTVEAEATQEINVGKGSVVKAFGQGSALNASFLQSQIQQLALDSRLDTAEDDALDTWTGQFSPPFTPRLPAVKAYSAPVAPTSLAAAATSTRLRVTTVNKLGVGQALRLENGTKAATTTIVTVEPTTTLLTAAGQGATNLNVSSTTGMTVNGYLRLTDGNYQVDVLITAITNATNVAIAPLTGLVAHTYVTGTTSVKLLNVLAVNALAFEGVAVLADFASGSTVRATSMLEGQRFYRNKADASSPSIPAKAEFTPGYRVQDKLAGVVYEVVADTTNPNYDALTNMYRMPANATEVFVKVEAVNAGVASHVTANVLTVMPTPLTGIDGTSNPYGIANASDRESNEAHRARFKLFVQGVGNTSSRPSIEAAIAGTQVGLQYTILEKVADDGVTPKDGHFVAVVADQFGQLSTELFEAVKTSVDKVRPITTTFSIKPPTLVVPTIVVKVIVSAPYVEATVLSAVQLAIYNSFIITASGAKLVFTKLMQLAQAVTGVSEIVRMTVDGNGFDNVGGAYVTLGTGIENITAGPLEFIRPGLPNITVTT